MLQRRVLERRFGVSRMSSRTMGQMLCKHDAARGFAIRMTGKAQKPPAILEGYDDVTGDAPDVGHLAPRETLRSRVPRNFNQPVVRMRWPY